MQLVSHGGHCCGIRHIYGLPYQPETALPALLPWKQELHPNSHLGTPYGHMFRHGIQERPAETGIERLDAFLAFLDGNNPGGITEIVLKDHYGKHDSLSQLSWVPVLERRGFKFVGRCINSNSANFIYVFHHYAEKNRLDAARPSLNPPAEPFPWEKFGMTPPADPEAGKNEKEGQ